MHVPPKRFGAELRRARHEAGMTLTRLASAVHYSKSQLSKIENGHQRPSAHLARRCEVELNCPGRLTSLLPGPSRTAGSSAPGGPPSRRLVLTAGAATVLLAHGAPGSASASASGEQTGDGALVDSARALLTHFRRMAQSCPPPAVLVPLAEQTRALVALAADSGSQARHGLLLVASRFAEFTGWLAQESGDDEAARRWTDHAVRLAFEGGDHQLGHYGLVRRALMAYYRGHARETVDLSAAAGNHRLAPRIRGLAAQQEAEGHALGGDHGASLRALDRARGLLAAADREEDPTPLGPTHLPDSVAMFTGWCLYDLGRPAAAAEHLDAACASLPPQAHRNHARHGVRRALAHASAGEIDHACAIARTALTSASAVGSYTIGLDLRRLSGVLERHRGHSGVRALAPDLTAALTLSAAARTAPPLPKPA
ncbi:helix-turn-helix domain-containing protein [Streptomyces sp. DSM 41037]|uniref:helix-turn-helix domain-containing protein n=1 Tax=Streptomyces sp. DSM 41037 TaxID=2817710 RepID=UPI0027D8E73E|nr:helix-turn-helix transcriptional regulator [Streptomyces sp. DSM 41037]